MTSTVTGIDVGFIKLTRNVKVGTPFVVSIFINLPRNWALEASSIPVMEWSVHAVDSGLDVVAPKLERRAEGALEAPKALPRALPHALDPMAWFHC